MKKQISVTRSVMMAILLLLKKYQAVLWSILAVVIVIIGLIVWQYAQQLPLRNAHTNNIDRFNNIELYAPIESEDRSVIHGGGMDVSRPYLQVERSIHIDGNAKEVLATVKNNLNKQSLVITKVTYAKKCNELSAYLDIKDSMDQEFDVFISSTENTNKGNTCDYIDIDQQTFEAKHVRYLFARAYYY